MISGQERVGRLVAEVRRRFSAIPIPPFLKMGALIALGVAPFVLFVTLQSNDGSNENTQELPTQPIGNQRIPLLFAFGTPEPSPLPEATPSASPSAEVTTTTKPASPSPAQCSDGRDNDRDGKTDLADSGCSSKTDNTEATAVATTRAPVAPPVTTTAPAPTTQAPTTVPPDTTTAPAATTEPEDTSPPATTSRRSRGQCDDGIDNDGDGRIDLDDKASCHGDPTDDE